MRGRKGLENRAQQILKMVEPVLANKVCQRSLGKVLAVGQCHAILQVVDGQHHHGEPFLSGFQGLLTEITKSEGVFQVGVIDFHTPALLVISQGLLHSQSQISADEVLGAFIPGAFFRDESVDRFSNVFQTALDKTGVILGCFVLFVHSLERNRLVRLVLERQVVLVNTYFVNTPV